MLSPFKAFYGREPTITSSILLIVDSLRTGSAEDKMRLIATKIFRLHAIAYKSLLSINTQKNDA